MFYEYAVDPECYANVDQIKKLEGEFGWGEGRLISKFPKAWLAKVREAQDAIIPKLKFRERGVLTEEWNWLRNNKDKCLINSGRDYDGNNHDWILNALHQNEIKPFHAIIAHEKASVNQDVLTPSELTGRQSRWKIRYDDRIARSPEALCNCVSRLIEQSDKIKLVDPYFKPNKKEWINTLSAFINLGQNSEIEYHIKVEDKLIENDIEIIKNEKYQIKEKEWYKKFSENCQICIKPILPLNREIKLFLWCEIDPSHDWFHDRYVLTEKGGVRFEALNEGENPGKRTNVFRLSEELWKDRWNSLSDGSEDYKLLGTIQVPEK
jgi:hypothetical protein